MDKDNCDFDTWFDALVLQLSEHGINFHDRDSVQGDYDSGADVSDVVDDIAAEYADEGEEDDD